MAKILVLEDDYTMSNQLTGSIKRRFANLRPEIETIDTESEFIFQWLPAFDRGRKQRPKAIIIDLGLRWTDPAPDQPPRPPEVIAGTFRKAGLRCRDLIRRHPVLSQTQVILYTNHPDMSSLEDTPEEVIILPKADFESIIRQLRYALERDTSDE